MPRPEAASCMAITSPISKTRWDDAYGCRIDLPELFCLSYISRIGRAHVVHTAITESMLCEGVVMFREKKESRIVSILIQTGPSAILER